MSPGRQTTTTRYETSRSGEVSERHRAQSTAARRRVRATRRRRRRRFTVAIGALATLALAVVIARPLFERAIASLSLPLQYQTIIRTEAAREHLDPDLIAAVIYAETRFDPRTSPAGAEGLMQLEPATAEFLARRSGGTEFTVSDLWTPRVNIAYGSYYLRYLLDEYHGSVWLALAAYNAGETNVDGWLSAARGDHRRLSIVTIPFPATRAYVQKVLQVQRDYRQTYPSQLGDGA